MDGALRVEQGQLPQSVKALAMRCSEDGVPHGLRSPEPRECWLAGSARYLGPASAGVHRSRLDPPQLTVVAGLALINVEAMRVLGVLNPSQPSEPSLWFSWPRTEVKAVRGGPPPPPWRTQWTISLTRGGCVLDLIGVYSLNPRSRLYLEFQERQLLEALGAKELTR